MGAVRRVARGTLRAVDPRLDEHVWAVERYRACRVEAPSLGRLSAELLRPLTGASRPVSAVVVPPWGPGVPTWQTASLNHFYEVATSLTEILGSGAVSVFGVGPEEPRAQWHERLIRHLAERRATHLVVQVETDPNQPESWSWDVLLRGIRPAWDGPVIGVMWDSWYPWISLRARRLGRLDTGLLLADFCEPMDGFARRGRPEVGPMTMPMSRETVEAIDEHVAGVAKEHELSFIGALYDYRVALLEELERLGIDVAVNPHRDDTTRNYEESRANQPSYLDYLAGIARSEFTLNFSRANIGPNEQYKIRVQEAALVGCLPLTDDRERTRRFFAPGQFETFGSLAEIAAIVQRRLREPERLRADQAAARRRAHELAATDFWGRIDDGLRRRGMRPLTGLTAPPPPQAS